MCFVLYTVAEKMMNVLLFVMVAVSAGSLRATAAAPADVRPPHKWSNGTTVDKDLFLGCKDKPADIYFLLDCSSSVWIVDFDKQKDFVISLVQHLDLHPNATRVGLGVYSEYFYHVLDIGAYADKDVLIRMIQTAPYLTGNTHTGKALEGMRTRGFRFGVVRPDVTKVGIVITDGRSVNYSRTAQEAAKAKEEHIWLFAIGVGGQLDTYELTSIASEPKKNFTFQVASFDILSTLIDTLALSTCGLAEPQADRSACGRTERGDVMFVYDVSTMNSDQLHHVKDFIAFLVSHFSMASRRMRVGLISRSTQGEDIDLNEYLGGQDFVNALNKQPRANFTSLFKKLRKRGFDTSYGARYNAKPIAVVFVDSVLEDSSNAIYEALLMKYEERATIHVITLGRSFDLSEVKQLASSEKHITQLESYSDLRKPAKRLEFLGKLCEGL